MFTRQGWGKTGMKVYCGAAANISVWYFFSGLDFLECVCAANRCSGVTFGSGAIEDVKRAASIFIFGVCV